MTRAHETESYQDRIVVDPEILAGKPVVRGTRIPVEVVLAYLSRNPNFEELFADYPRLTMADVQACFAYAHRTLEQQPRRSPIPPTRRAV